MRLAARSRSFVALGVLLNVLAPRPLPAQERTGTGGERQRDIEIGRQADALHDDWLIFG